MLLAGILMVGLVFAWIGIQKGLYAMIATLFCLMFAVYIGVLASPKIIQLSHGAQQGPWYAAGCVLGTTLVVFVLLWIIAFFYFLYKREDYFSERVDKIGGGVCGFFFGYILGGLLLLLACMTPAMEYEHLPQFCRRDTAMRYAVPPVTASCNFIAKYSLECFYGDTEKAVDFLLFPNARPEK